jgi:hypothetical protein
MHVVCAWIGNSQAVAAKHYLQVTDDHFSKAVQNPVQQAAEPGCTGVNDDNNSHEKPPVLQGSAASCSSVQVARVGDEGLKPQSGNIVKRRVKWNASNRVAQSVAQSVTS